MKFLTNFFFSIRRSLICPMFAISQKNRTFYEHLSNFCTYSGEHTQNFPAKLLRKNFPNYFLGICIILCLTLSCYSHYAKCILTQHIAFHFGHDSSFYRILSIAQGKKNLQANKNENNTKKSDIQEKTLKKKTSPNEIRIWRMNVDASPFHCAILLNDNCQFCK